MFLVASLLVLAIVPNIFAHNSLQREHKHSILAIHNEVRSAVQHLPAHLRPIQPLKPLKWDDSLIREEDIPCRYDHSMTVAKVARRKGNATTVQRGENWFAAPYGVDVVEGVRQWAAEASNYIVSKSRKTSRSMFGVRGMCAAGKVCLHYTQMIWRQTKTVGCAVRSCASNTALFPLSRKHQGANYLVCVYSGTKNPNRVGRAPYNPAGRRRSG